MPERLIDIPSEAPGSYRVLDVDDNRDAAEAGGLLLALDGHDVRQAHDGLSAVSDAEDFQPAVIFMDIGLPGFNGNEGIRQIRALQGPVRPFIIALTGWGASTDRDATFKAGCDVHMIKPVSHEELREAMNTWASRERQRHDKS